MVRLAIKDPELFFRLRKHPVIRPFVGFRMTEYDECIRPEIQAEIFASFYVSDGTTRQTRADRFHDVDPITLSILQQGPAGAIHDVGVADGMTSLRLLQGLRANGLSHPVVISDKYSRITIVKKGLPRIYDDNDTMTAVYVGALIGEHCPPVFIVNRILYRLLNRKKPHDAAASTTICLFAPDVNKAILSGDLQERCYGVLCPAKKQEFAFVRCMNLLNRGYFNDEQIAAAVKNIWSSLKEDGILLIGRTMPGGRNDASFFRKTPSGFVLLQNVNNGYEGAGLLPSSV